MRFLPFEKLQVFQLSEQLADDIWDMVIQWSDFEKDTVGKQLIRAADSVGANIAEGAGRGTKKENQRFVRIARGSLNEVRFWLRRAYRRDLLAEQKTESLKELLDHLAPCVNAYLRSIAEKTPNTKHETPNTNYV